MDDTYKLIIQSIADVLLTKHFENNTAQIALYHINNDINSIKARAPAAEAKVLEKVQAHLRKAILFDHTNPNFDRAHVAIDDALTLLENLAAEKTARK